MICGARMRRVVVWAPPMAGVLKFNVDSAARGKPRPTGIGGVLCNDKGVVLGMFSKGVGIRDLQ